MGIGGCCDHVFRFAERHATDYFSFPQMIRNCIVVTGACMMLRREIFKQSGGFDADNLPIAFNDVDLWPWNQDGEDGSRVFEE